MSRLEPLDDDAVPGGAAVFGAGAEILGFVPNSLRIMARKPAMVRGPYADSWHRSPQASLVGAAILGAQCGDPDPRSLFRRSLTMESRQDFATLRPGYEAEQRARLAQLIALVDAAAARSTTGARTSGGWSRGST